MLGAVSSEAAPFYRVWRGYKKPEISSEVFNKAIQDVFVEATVENGAGYGLQAYIPALPVPSTKVKLPDEIALVVYESKEKYEAQRATAIGKAYGDLHWEYFTRAPVNPEDPVPEYVSKSAVPEVVTDKITSLENLKAYDFRGQDADWQKGLTKIRFFERKEQATDELILIQKLQSDYASKALAYILLVDEKYFMTYELWESADVLKKSETDFFISENFSEIEGAKNQIVADKTPYNLEGMQNLKLEVGGALSAQFDKSTKAQYVKKEDISKYVDQKIRENYSTLIEYDLLEEVESNNKLKQLYLVSYEDEQGVPVVHEAELSFVFEKSVLHPEGQHVVVEDGIAQQ